MAVYQAFSNNMLSIQQSQRQQLQAIEYCLIQLLQGVLLLDYVVVVGIQPLGRSGQRQELSQAIGMALVRCILGKFLGVVCHCFPLLFRCFHFSPPGTSTSTTT